MITVQAHLDVSDYMRAASWVSKWNIVFTLSMRTDMSEQTKPRRLIRPRGYKTFFMLNSAAQFVLLINLKLLTTANSFLLNIAEHDIFSANEYVNANYCLHFHIY